VIVYLDTSSLLKLYLEEEGRQSVIELVRHSVNVAASLVAYAEARSGLARAHDVGRLTVDGYREALEAFEDRWTAAVVVEPSGSLVRWAGDLAAKHLIRGFDAIHLASALAFQDSIGELVTFSAWDDRLLGAARAEGLAIAPTA